VSGAYVLGRGEGLGLAALGVLILALNATPITNNDIFLHLKTGSIILAHGTIPHEDDYSALARGRPFIAHEWLAAVVFQVVHAVGGFDGLILFKVAVAIAVAAALYAAARTLAASAIVAVPTLALVMVLAAARFMERPHIFSYLLTAVFLLLLARRRTGSRAPMWCFALLQCLWANLHGGFVLGPAVVLLAAGAEATEGGLHALISWMEPKHARRKSPDRSAGAVDRAAAPTGKSARRLRRRKRAADSSNPPASTGGHGVEASRRHFREAGRLAILAAALVAICVVNPYGVRLLAFPFELTGSAVFMQTNYEWLPPFASTFARTYTMRYYVAWIIIGSVVLLAALALALKRRELPAGGVFPFLVFGFFLTLSLRMNRNVADFGLATFPGIAAAATSLQPGLFERPAKRSLLPWIALALFGLAGWFAVEGYPLSSWSRRPFGLGLGPNAPVAAADYLEANGIRGNAFNSYDTGAYLVYRFYPAIRVAMDSRNDVYGEELYRQYGRALHDQRSLAAMLERIDASFILLDWRTQGAELAPMVRRLGDWRLVFFDDRQALYLRGSGEHAPLVERDGYSVVDPSSFRPGALRPQDASLALKEAERATKQNRGAYISRVMKIDALIKLGNLQEAFDEEARIVREAPPIDGIHAALGLLRLSLGQKREAAVHFRHALELSPELPVALWGLKSSSDESS
jgi:tetratricopeptide (TPR) repeat protein